MTDSELLALIFGGEAHALREACAAWIASSRPFRLFLEENAGKIRKKARQAGDVETLRDVQLEMDAAYRLLLADRRVALVYERYLADKTRGPDFTVTYKGHLIFNVEVRRLRAPVAAGKLGEAVREKLRQMPPSAVNVLLVGADASESPDLDAPATMKRLILRAEARQDDYFIERGYRDARDFLRALQRLSGLLLRANWRDTSPSSPILWLNPHARHPLPADVRKLLLR
ncbi:MAG TPA: hypothetical protein VFQ25_17480 [Ktedonobacterales bacterium]|nr:hypothetical protein [Ktedonobacterales bacterium]